MRIWPNGIRHQPSKLATQVRFLLSAPLRRKHMRTCTWLLPRGTRFEAEAAHHAGVTGTRHTWPAQNGSSGSSTLPARTDGHWGNWQTRRALNPETFLVRSQDGQLRRRARLAARPS